MLVKKSVAACLAACGMQILLAPAFAQTAQAGATTTTSSTSTGAASTKLSNQYAEFAGSQENANALVNGLRNDKPVTLTATTGVMSFVTPSATFTPATGKLGVGEVNIALSLAKTALEKEGITNPTPTQLAAALNGGTFATTNGTVTLTGVLAQRQDGQGWGQVAKSMGVTLGSIVSASKTNKPEAKSEKSEHASKAGGHGKSDDSAKGSASGRSSATNSNGGSGSGNSGGGGKK